MSFNPGRQQHHSAHIPLVMQMHFRCGRTTVAHDVRFVQGYHHMIMISVIRRSTISERARVTFLRLGSSLAYETLSTYRQQGLRASRLVVLNQIPRRLGSLNDLTDVSLRRYRRLDFLLMFL